MNHGVGRATQCRRVGRHSGRTTQRHGEGERNRRPETPIDDATVNGGHQTPACGVRAKGVQAVRFEEESEHHSGRAEYDGAQGNDVSNYKVFYIKFTFSGFDFK